MPISLSHAPPICEEYGVLNFHTVQTLQSRRKWQQTQENIQEGDLVILKDGDQHRNIWPLGLIEHVFPSDDNLVEAL
jgi:hypothetical protein